MKQKRFQKKVEDFICLNCKQEVIGSGFTNHCPHCLWSKHVDINPGDREEGCQGPMQPIAIEHKNPMRIMHRCTKCGFRRPNKVTENDSQEALRDIARTSSL